MTKMLVFLHRPEEAIVDDTRKEGFGVVVEVVHNDDFVAASSPCNIVQHAPLHPHAEGSER